MTPIGLSGCLLFRATPIRRYGRPHHHMPSRRRRPGRPSAPAIDPPGVHPQAQTPRKPPQGAIVSPPYPAGRSHRGRHLTGVRGCLRPMGLRRPHPAVKSSLHARHRAVEPREWVEDDRRSHDLAVPEPPPSEEGELATRMSSMLATHSVPPASVPVVPTTRLRGVRVPTFCLVAHAHSVSPPTLGHADWFPKIH